MTTTPAPAGPRLAPTPAGEARWLLPADAYWSPAWFEAERREVFARSWQLAGTVEDLDSGALVVEVAGTPVVLEHTADGVIRAAIEPGSERRPAAVGRWGCFVFVHLDPATAPPFDEWLGDVPERIGGFHPERLVEVARHRADVACNWKLFVENHIDAYHLWFLHAESLSAYDHPGHRWGEIGRHWLFYEPPRTDLDMTVDGIGRGLLPIAHVGTDVWGSGAHLLFPNLPFATGAGFFLTYQAIPRGPALTTIDMRMRVEPGSDAAEAMALSRTIIEGEDGAACEALQAAVRSPWFEVGPLAVDHELAITRFQANLLEVMGR